MASGSVFRRYEKNPIIVPDQVQGANSIFNSAVVRQHRNHRLAPTDLRNPGGSARTLLYQGLHFARRSIVDGNLMACLE
jgi:hypothetical protein